MRGLPPLHANLRVAYLAERNGDAVRLGAVKVPTEGAGMKDEKTGHPEPVSLCRSCVIREAEGKSFGCHRPGCTPDVAGRRFYREASQ